MFGLDHSECLLNSRPFSDSQRKCEILMHKLMTSPYFIFYFFIIKGSATLKRSEVTKETARKARVKSEMCVALETCCQLHKAGELSDDLQPRFRYADLQDKTLKDSASFCYCEYVLHISGYLGFLRKLLPNTTIFLRGL